MITKPVGMPEYAWQKELERLAREAAVEPAPAPPPPPPPPPYVPPPPPPPPLVKPITTAEAVRVAQEAEAQTKAEAAARDAALIAQAEQEAIELAAVREAAAKAREEEAARARAEAEAIAKAEAETAAAVDRARVIAEAEAQARDEAERIRLEVKAQAEAEAERIRLDQEAIELAAVREATRLAREEVARKAREQAEAEAKAEAQAQIMAVQVEAERVAAIDAAAKAQAEQEAIELAAVREAARLAREAVEVPPEEVPPPLVPPITTAEAVRRAKEAEVAKARAEAEARAKAVAVEPPPPPELTYEEFQASLASGEIVHLYGETYFTREVLESIKAETPELFAILIDPARGHEAYLAEFKKRQAAYEKEVAEFEAEVYPTLSPDLQLSYTKGKEANDFTTYNQNVASYNLAVEKLQERVDKAEVTMVPFKSLRVDEPDAYNVKQALMTRDPKVIRAVELLFDKAVVDALYEKYPFLKPGYVTPPKIEWEPGAGPTEEEQKILGITVSPALTTILGVAVPAAVAEPTFLGELLVLAAVGSYLAYQTLKKKEGAAILPEITRTAEVFKSQQGREITVDDVTRTLVRDTAEVSIMVAKPIPVSPPDFPRVEVKLGVPPFPVVRPIPLQPPDFPKIEVEMKVPPFPIAKPIPVSPPPFPARIEPVLSQIIATQIAVAVADDELATIIKPKIMTPSQLDVMWNVPLDKKAQALVALDAAVQDAYTAGEIDADDLRVYQTARDNYLTKRGVLDSAIKTASDMLGLPEAETEEHKKLATDVIIAHNAVMEARRVWAEYQARAIAEPTPVTAEQMALQQVRTQEGMRLATEAAERARAFEDVLKVYYNAVGETQEAYLAKIAEYQLKLPSDISSLIAAATQLALQNIQEQANQAAIKAYNEAIAKDLAATQAATAAQTAAQNAVKTASQTATQQAVKTATQTAVQTATQTMTKTAAKAATKTLTSTATQTAVNTAVNTAVQTAVQTLTQTATQTATKVLPIILPPLPEEEAARRKKGIYPAGTVVWRQGAWWKIIPPPYDIKKPISSRTPPSGVIVMRGTPQETLTFTEGKVPSEDVSFDLGVTDGFIDVKRKTIVFKGGGLETDVGKRIPSPTKGMSIGEGIDRHLIDTETFPGELAGQGVSRARISKRKPKRKGKRLTNWEYMTTLKGFRP